MQRGAQRHSPRRDFSELDRRVIYAANGLPTNVRTFNRRGRSWRDLVGFGNVDLRPRFADLKRINSLHNSVWRAPR